MKPETITEYYIRVTKEALKNEKYKPYHKILKNKLKEIEKNR